MRNEHDAAGNYIPCKSVDEMTIEELREEARLIRAMLGADNGVNKIFSLPYLIDELLSDRDHCARSGD